MQTYYAHGKLLLTGEYVVLDGAQALALPTRWGQKMTIESHSDLNTLHWKGWNVKGQIWLEGEWDIHQQTWTSISHPEKAQYLELLLKYAKDELGIDFGGHLVQTYLEFDNQWGLGSSSTLVSLLAQWWHTDPYFLLYKSFGGSGYDIACATADQPILYQRSGLKVKVEPVSFIPPFRDRIAFVFLGQKQDSREGIQKYKSLPIDKTDWIAQVNDITKKILLTEELDEFEYWISLHEVIVSRALRIEKVKDRLFPDYWGAAKSLGAWGGDFILVTHEGDVEEAQEYFAQKGYEVFISYDEMILQQ